MLLLLLLLLLLLSNSRSVTSSNGRRTGCAAVSAEPWMANRERALLLSARRIDLGKWKALSFGYFSLGKQRKVTRAPQAIGSLAGDFSLLLERHGGKHETSLDSRLRGNDEQDNSNSKIKVDSSVRWNDGGV
ncbi:hypothetical protein L3D22_15840 [Lysobacter soli]|uniref:hypothetical protein n=1 Tax=Lysobacter soli TaxID=453783 RepID=UPI00209E7386|nr:hypothetical protein [Lysobacter soli]UTA53785.1 hypothetical protein L3D22_15840 [Lysobacter soli]